MNEYKEYKRTGISLARDYIPNENMIDISVSSRDEPKKGGKVFKNPKKEDDFWYVNETYFNDNYELVDDQKSQWSSFETY